MECEDSHYTSEKDKGDTDLHVCNQEGYYSFV